MTSSDDSIIIFLKLVVVKAVFCDVWELRKVRQEMHASQPTCHKTNIHNNKLVQHQQPTAYHEQLNGHHKAQADVHDVPQNLRSRRWRVQGPVWLHRRSESEHRCREPASTRHTRRTSLPGPAEAVSSKSGSDSVKIFSRQGWWCWNK